MSSNAALPGLLTGFLADTIPALQLLIQDHKVPILEQALAPELGFRKIASPERMKVPVGNQEIRFRGNLLNYSLAPINPSTFNGDLDNGLTPKTRAAESYTLTPQMWADTMDLKKFNNITALVQDYIDNAKALAQQSEGVLDRNARNVLYNNYMSGQTFATAATSSSTSLHVDDVTGFTTVMVNGVPTAVSSTNALSITVNNVANTVTGVSLDSPSTSIKPYGGQSGTLTLGSAISASAGQVVKSNDNTRIVRPLSSNVERASDLALAVGDLLTFNQLRRTKTYLKNQGVRMINGKYNVYMLPDSMDQLAQDAEFISAFRGTGTTSYYGNGTITELLDLRLITNNIHTNVASGATSGSSSTSTEIFYPIMVGEGALVEGDYLGTEDLNAYAGGQSLALHDVKVINGVSHIDRASLDRLGLTMSQSWMWSGCWACSTDSLVTPAVFETASNSRFKRAAVMPHSAF